jgi:hypothetical protein
MCWCPLWPAASVAEVGVLQRCFRLLCRAGSVNNRLRLARSRMAAVGSRRGLGVSGALSLLARDTEVGTHGVITYPLWCSCLCLCVLVAAAAVLCHFPSPLVLFSRCWLAGVFSCGCVRTRWYELQCPYSLYSVVGARGLCGLVSVCRFDAAFDWCCFGD